MTDDLRDLRDRLAGLCGWVFEPGVRWIHPDFGGRPPSCHPFPPNSIDALAAAWPEGWYLVSRMLEPDRWEANAWLSGDDNIKASEAPTEYEARLRLTIAVLEAEQ